MDATANGHPKGVDIQGFPTLVFFDAKGEKRAYDGERELPAFKTWSSLTELASPPLSRSASFKVYLFNT